MTEWSIHGVRQSARRWAPRQVLQWVGEVLLTLGVVLLLFAFYQLVYTNIAATREHADIGEQLHREWTTRPAVSPAEVNKLELALGRGFALMRIPRLGTDWEKPVIHGVRPKDLARGVGHEPETASPGAIGNFAVAGHRATRGEPFAYLDRVRVGDLIAVETSGAVYEYRVTGREIVLPNATEVLLPVPREPDVVPTKAVITLITCNPRWGSSERLIVYGDLDRTTMKNASK